MPKQLLNKEPIVPILFIVPGLQYCQCRHCQCCGTTAGLGEHTGNDTHIRPAMANVINYLWSLCSETHAFERRGLGQGHVVCDPTDVCVVAQAGLELVPLPSVSPVLGLGPVGVTP